MKIKRLDERAPTAKVKSALFGDNRGIVKTFAVLTAANPLGVPLTDLENRQRNNDLRKEIEDDRKKFNAATMRDLVDRGHYQYIPIKGKYGIEEPSFIVFNITLDDAKKLSSSGEQESFWFGRCRNEKDNNGNFIQPNATVTYYYYDKSYYDETGKFKYNKVGSTQKVYDWSDMKNIADNFSRYGSLTWNFDFADAVANGRIARDVDELDESLREDVIPSRRMRHRVWATFYNLPENYNADGAFVGAKCMWDIYDLIEHTVKKSPNSGVVPIGNNVEKAHAIKELTERNYDVSVDKRNNKLFVRYWRGSDED